MSVVVKMTLLVGLTVAVLLAVLLTASGWYWRRVIYGQVDAQLSSVATSRKDMVQAQVALLRQRVLLNTDRNELRGYFYELVNKQPPSGNRDASQVTLQRIADGRPVIAASLVESSGKIILSTNPDEVGRSIRDEPEFQEGMVGPHVGRPRWTGARYESVLTAPIFSRLSTTRAYGVLRLVADVSDLAGALRDVTGLGQSGEAILGMKNGEQLEFLFPPRNAPQTHSGRLVDALEFRAATEGVTNLIKTRDYRGVPVLAADRAVGYGGWIVMVKMDEAEAYAPITDAWRLGLLFGLFVAAAGLATAYLLALSFTRPVRQLAQAASRLTSGDYETVVPVKSTDEFGKLSATFNEMTAAIRNRRRERDRAEEALRETDRRKDEFLAMLGHELRNPLAAIAHAVHLEQESTTDAAAIEVARRVVARQTSNLTRLVDDLLDVARITRGKIELHRSPVELGSVIKRAIDTIRPVIDERRHQLDLLLSGGKYLMDADPTRLEQIVTNLLANAVKYTPDGGRIRIQERHEGQEAILTISDNGIGIAPEMLPRIFDLFTQADHSLDRASGGLGLGLCLCKQLVELHGGTIVAESRGIGEGATFTVRLPVLSSLQKETALADTPTATKPAPSHVHRRILLVDDNQDTVHSLSRLLARRGHEVASAFDGLSALRLAHEFKPDVLLLDLGLPGLDGYELARRLRSEGFAHSPIIAISGYAQESDRAKSREAGFNYHFAKPVDFEALVELIVEEPLAVE